MAWWPWGSKQGGVLPDVPLATPMPPVASPRDIVDRLQDAVPRSIVAYRYSDGVMRDPLMVEAANEIERLRRGLVGDKSMVPMCDGGANAYRLVSMLVDALGHLSGLQQGEHLMSAEDVETHEIILVNAACEIYTSLTGVRISSIGTFKKMDANKATC